MITTYQLNYVLKGIQRQIPVYKSLDKLNISRYTFYNDLSLEQRRLFDEYRCLYRCTGEDSIRTQLRLRDITFEAAYICMLSLRVV